MADAEDLTNLTLAAYRAASAAAQTQAINVGFIPEVGIGFRV